LRTGGNVTRVSRAWVISVAPDGWDVEGVYTEQVEGVKESYRRIDIIEKVEEMLDVELSDFARSKGRMDTEMVLEILDVLGIPVEEATVGQQICLEEVLNQRYGLDLDIWDQRNAFNRDDWWEIMELVKEKGSQHE